MTTVKKYKRQSLLQLLLILGIVVVANIIFSRAFMRFDLTEEGRYTISQPTKDILHELDDVVYFQILLDGDLPAEYRRLQKAITETLDEYRIYSDRQIEYSFFNPFDLNSREQVNKVIQDLTKQGVVPRPIAEQNLGEVSQKVLLPSAIVSYKGKELAVNFLPEQKAANEDATAVVNNGISTLEYNLSSTIQKLMQTRKKRILFTEGHGELPRPLIADMGVTLQQEQFDVSFIDLTKRVGIPPLTDLVIMAKPTLPFADKDKFKLDQYIMQGGHVLWLIDEMQANLDSLMTGKPEFVALDMKHNLDEMLFSYGVRINKDLILDKEANPIPLFSSNGKVRNFYLWPFYPIVYTEGNNPIVKHLDPIMVRFASSIDTIKTPSVKKTILLHSSQQSTAWKTPVLVRLSVATQPLMDEEYGMSDLPMAVLLEGKFQSYYKGWVAQSFIDTYEDSLGMQYREQSEPTSMIVISDGDLIRNGYSEEQGIQLLGQYPFNPNVRFANKDFLMNCVDYLTDNHGLIATRTKDFKVRPLNHEQVRQEQYKWQLLNLIIPAVVILLFAGVYNFIRKKKYEGKV